MREYEANRLLLDLEQKKLTTQSKELKKLKDTKESKLDRQVSLLL
jgi:hypothetical protein